jgi:hypothetical protein
LRQPNTEIGGQGRDRRLARTGPPISCEARLKEPIMANDTLIAVGLAKTAEGATQ